MQSKSLDGVSALSKELFPAPRSNNSAHRQYSWNSICNISLLHLPKYNICLPHHPHHVKKELLAQQIVPRPHALDLHHLTMPVGVGDEEVRCVGNRTLLLSLIVPESRKERVGRLQADADNLAVLLSREQVKIDFCFSVTVKRMPAHDRLACVVLVLLRRVGSGQEV